MSRWLWIGLAVLALSTACRSTHEAREAESVLTIVESAGVAGDVPPFEVLPREPRLAKAPCANCHTVSLDRLRSDGSDGRTRAHWAVEMAHATEAVMTCATCHAPTNLAQLRTLTGGPLGFDEAHVVCAQCHSTQAADWTGGAHGKRVGGWASPRVVYNCTECHDPHRPALDTRWPARAGRQER